MLVFVAQYQLYSIVPGWVAQVSLRNSKVARRPIAKKPLQIVDRPTARRKPLQTVDRPSARKSPQTVDRPDQQQESLFFPRERSIRPPELYYYACAIICACAYVLARIQIVLCCWAWYLLLRTARRHWWLREPWKKTVHRVLLYHVKAPWLKLHFLVGQDREPWPTASPYLLPYSHCRASHSCWTVSERLWTLLIVFCTPIAAMLNYCLPTHCEDCWHYCVYSPLSCCIVPSPPAKPSWMVCVMCSSILNSSELNKGADTATPWTARIRVNVSHMSTSSHVNLRGHSFYQPLTPLYLMVSEIVHLFLYHTIVFIFNNKISTTYNNRPFQKEQLKTYSCV